MKFKNGKTIRSKRLVKTDYSDIVRCVTAVDSHAFTDDQEIIINRILDELNIESDLLCRIIEIMVVDHIAERYPSINDVKMKLDLILDNIPEWFIIYIDQDDNIYNEAIAFHTYNETSQYITDKYIAKTIKNGSNNIMLELYVNGKSQDYKIKPTLILM